MLAFLQIKKNCDTLELVLFNFKFSLSKLKY